MRNVRLIIWSFMSAFFLFGCGTKIEKSQEPISDTGSLRYDGLYCFINDLDGKGLINNYVLRFYEDGVVIAVSIEQTETEQGYFPHESWFNKEAENYADLLGSYECIDGKISFATISEYGTVDYHGTIQKNQLVLDSHSNINGHDAFNREYVFYPFEEISGWYDM